MKERLTKKNSRNNDEANYLLYFFPEYNNYRQNNIIIFWKYLGENRRKALLNLYWGYIQ
jgi:hypothetical protein